MTQEFHISVTPVGEDMYLVRTERVAPGVPLAEEQVVWPVEDWLVQARQLMNDPLLGLLQESAIPDPENPRLPFLTASSASPTSNLVALGQQLYNALFQGSIRDSWVIAQGVAQHRREVLRLRLGLKGNRLPRLPWEVLHAGDRPLATGLDVVFSRYQPTFTPLVPPLQFQPIAREDSKQPLKILMAIAAPSDQDSLALKQEAVHLQEELQRRWRSGREGTESSPDIQLTILEQPDREQLTQALEQGDYEVLHYAGHSNLSAAGGDLYLVSGRTGLTETLSGDDLAGLLVNNGIRMAVFNSCRGAYTAASDSIHETGERNLAEVLVKRGIPGVLAMAERIPDDVALTLSRLFYRNLKQGYPVDLSISRARQGLISAYGSHQLYWALPILYLHPEFDGCLTPCDDQVNRVVEPLMFSQGWRSLDQTAEEELLLLVDDDPLAPGFEEEIPNFLESADLYLYEETEFDETELEDIDFPEDLEYDDPDYDKDSAFVADIISQLTSLDEPEEPILPASRNENLLPNADSQRKPYLDIPDNPKYPLPPPIAGAGKLTLGSFPGQDVSAALAPVNGFAAEESVEQRKLRAAIATYRQAIQANPHDVDAYNQVGLALAQQGNLSEAIAAYKQAIAINPTIAVTHHNLGLALAQQGHLTEAIAAYEQALQINPQLTDAYNNLGVALHRQGRPDEARAVYAQALNLVAPEDRNRPFADKTSNKTANSSDPSRTPGWLRPVQRHPLAWAGVGVIGLAAAIWAGIGTVQWFEARRQDPLLIPPIAEIPIDLGANEDLATTDTARTTALATQYLNQGNLPAGQEAVEALLDRGALPQARTALSTVPANRDTAPISFLRGRLAWQSVQTQNPDFSVDDARRYWETAMREKSDSLLYHNALGFAYYAEDNLDRANQVWFQALYLEQAQQQATPNETTATSTATSETSEEAVNRDVLTAYAGLALVLMKTVDSQPADEQANRQSKAINLYRKVMTDDPLSFQPEALSQNWLWPEQAIADWRSLAELAAQSE